MGDAIEPDAQPNAETALDFAAVQARYAQEKAKRLHPEGVEQYVELTDSDQLQSLASDPWVDHDALNAEPPSLRNGDDIKVLILGAGYGGLLYAIHFIQQGISPSDILRHGGYTYMPLLEETGYVPKHRFSYGPELLDYAGVLADKWDLRDKGVFRSTVRSYDWDADAVRWITKIQQGRGPGQADVEMTVRAQFVVVANGVLNHPKVPRSLQGFEGPTTHTARFDYGITGGAPRDQQLTKLRGKRVGIVGTGATAVQVIPELAKYAGELYVFQRTPSGVTPKHQRETQAEDWKAMTAGKPG
ncbi:FAD-binding monooxygenase trt3 like protein [Verticillium longisporum]|uniref:FAD-binding monooxygenase trt3 like protein n=1 Tax=Verticillium longisporum TaxID=100787 RepID=A0A8I2ZNF0_VERLO|nr:FAD-binding monooxygenase trt3 like protein [Verticillium longisporum]